MRFALRSGMTAAALSLFLLRNPLFASSPLEGFPRVVLWAWERPEDLRFLAGRDAGVAFLAVTATLSGGAVLTRRRREPLLVDPATPVMAVVRVETVRGFKPALSQGQREAVVRAALEAARLPRVAAVQIDGDAAASERAFFRGVLTDLRARLDPRLGLSFTALASWCAGDRWLGGLPVDEAVPMLFQMGADAAAIRTRAAEGRLAPECRAAVGFSTEEPAAPTRGRVYLFSPEPWTETSFERELSRISR
ncbi:MAG TPA: hypothetical protein VMN04_12780 [Thermoanaerobaculia bacterium]|nr:hypothetical protein [Thermoanaerobaculia bacterium]